MLYHGLFQIDRHVTAKTLPRIFRVACQVDELREDSIVAEVGPPQNGKIRVGLISRQTPLGQGKCFAVQANLLANVGREMAAEAIEQDHPDLRPSLIRQWVSRQIKDIFNHLTDDQRKSLGFDETMARNWREIAHTQRLEVKRAAPKRRRRKYLHRRHR